MAVVPRWSRRARNAGHDENDDVPDYSECPPRGSGARCFGDSSAARRLTIGNDEASLGPRRSAPERRVGGIPTDWRGRQGSLRPPSHRRPPAGGSVNGTLLLAAGTRLSLPRRVTRSARRSPSGTPGRRSGWGTLVSGVRCPAKQPFLLRRYGKAVCEESRQERLFRFGERLHAAPLLRERPVRSRIQWRG